MSNIPVNKYTYAKMTEFFSLCANKRTLGEKLSWLCRFSFDHGLRPPEEEDAHLLTEAVESFLSKFFENWMVDLSSRGEKRITYAKDIFSRHIVPSYTSVNYYSDECADDIRNAGQDWMICDPRDYASNTIEDLIKLAEGAEMISETPGILKYTMEVIECCISTRNMEA